MKTPARILIALLFVVSLGGCGLVSVNHPTTESRYMTQAEQDFWIDKRDRQDKSDEWRRELARQSRERMARYMGN